MNTPSTKTEIPKKKDLILHPDFEVDIELKEDGYHVFFRNQEWEILWFMRYNIIEESSNKNTALIYVNDTISSYKFEANCPKSTQDALKKHGTINTWTPGFWKIMAEFLIRYLRETLPSKVIHLNFVSLDRKVNIQAIQNLVFEVAKRCEDLCAKAANWNIENYTATIQIWDYS